MQFNPHELKDKLLKALDKDNNVVDMGAVQEVISRLEKYPITKDTLEQTRIGRTVNDLRKKTTDKELAKRAKNLVRKWQSLITPSNHTVNGEGVGGGKVGPGVGPHLPPHVIQSRGNGSTPASPASRPITPHSGTKSSSNSPLLPNSRPLTPGTAHQKLSPKPGMRPITPGFKPQSPALMTSTPKTAAPASAGMRIGNISESRKAGRRIPNKKSEQQLHTPSDAFSKTDVANKRKRRAEISPPSSIPEKKSLMDGKYNGSNGDSSHKSEKRNGIIASSSCSVSPELQSTTSNVEPPSGFASRKNANLLIKTPSNNVYSSRLERSASASSLHSDRSLDHLRTPVSARTPKVKTTAELIKHLASRKEFSISGSETVTKIALNQIEKEHEIEVSNVPFGARPRPRKTPGALLNPPNTSDVALSKTKNEMVHKFLASSFSTHDEDLANLVHLNTPVGDLESPGPLDSCPQTPGGNLSNVDSGHASLSSMKEEHSNASPNNAMRGKKRHATVTHIIEQHPHIADLGLSDEEILAKLSDDPFSLLAPVRKNSIEWDRKPSPIYEGSEVNETSIERLHHEAWSGVNGNFDHNHDWHDWTQTLSVPSYHGDLVHILPYVSIDD